MEFVDKTLTCVDCGDEFTFTAGEQIFFHDKQFTHDPKRCKKCKGKRQKSGFVVKNESQAVCSECGVQTTVPFKPTRGLPVFCRSCFQKRASTGGAVPDAVN